MCCFVLEFCIVEGVKLKGIWDCDGSGTVLEFRNP